MLFAFEQGLHPKFLGQWCYKCVSGIQATVPAYMGKILPNRDDIAALPGRRSLLTGATVAAVGLASSTRAAAPAKDGGIIKQVVHNPDKGPNSGTHALRLRNVSEWMFFAGHSAIGAHGEILFPGDAIAQMRWIWGSLERLLVQEGYSLGDVIQLKMTCIADVPMPDRVKFLEIVGEVFQGQKVMPVGSTMSVVDALALPGMLCEVDITAAR